MNYPEDLLYTETDEWIRVEGNTATIGISDYAQDQLSDIVYLEVSVEEGDEVAKGDPFGTVESVKAASDIYLPVSGTVMAINDDLPDTPEVINSDPYGAGWMIKLELSESSELEALLDQAAYAKSVEERES
jgi:glycine cleavage system H protein